MSPWHVVILAGTDPRGEDLAKALRRRRWRVWSPSCVPPGADRDASLVTALNQCALAAVLSAQDIDERAAVKVAIHGWRRDRSGTKVVPVGVVTEHEAALTGLNLLQGCPWTDAEEVAARLDRELEAGRARDDETASVIVLAHPTEIVELDRILAAVASRRRVEKPVRTAWVDDPDAEKLAEATDLVLLILGLAVSKEGAARLVRIAESARCRRVLRRTITTAGTVASCGDLPTVLALRGDDPGLEGDDLVCGVTEQLEAWLDDRFRGDGTSGLHPWEKAYLSAKCLGWTNGNHLGLMKIAGGTALTRAVLYVPGRAGPGPWRREDSGRVTIDRSPQERSPDERAPDKEEIWLDELVSHRDLPAVVVEGEAGTGKTVLLQHVAALMASRALGLRTDEEEHLDWDALANGAPRCRVPVLLEARTLAAKVAEAGSARALPELIAAALFPSGSGPTPLAKIEEGFEEGRYLLLIDGRDEAPAEQLALLDEALVQVTTLHPRLRVLVATRPAAHTATRLGHPFQVVPLAALNDADRAAMAQRWCATYEDKRGDRDHGLPSAMAELSARVAESAADGDRSPLDNPLFFTAALLVYQLDGKLPEGRADLYDKLVEVLCRSRGPVAQSGGEQERREVAIAVALAAQQARVVALPVHAANEAVQRARGYASVREAAERIDAMAVHTMLWRYEDGAEGRVIRPWHRSFLEHLAATGEASSGRPAVEVATRLRAELHEPAWAGCVRFLPGAFVAVHSDRGVEWIEALANLARVEPDLRRRGHLLALVADAVAEERDRCYARRRDAGGSGAARLATEVAEHFVRDGAEYGWEDRLMLLDGLGRMATAGELGWEGVESGWLVDPRLPDPRTGIGRWVEVPGGPYRLGEKEAFQSGKVRTETVPAFYLLDTPVTAQDYRPFVASGAWHDPAFRLPDAPSPQRPPDWERQVRHPNRPVWGVDWWDAVAFCAWASTTWTLPSGGQQVSLPSAAMWEAAARGPKGDPCPWGKNEDTGQGDMARAAYDWEPRGAGPLRGPPSVGAFPRGHRGRLMDLAGNVWEWTASPWSEDGSSDSVDGRQLSGAAPRVGRGGSWVSSSRPLRAADRARGRPDSRFEDLGFRVCVLREPGR
jgi:formylglycine-generating enzyme required for sulfatase activity